MIKIDKNVPIPQSYLHEKGSRYPLAEMDVGDSYWVECPEGKDLTRHQSNMASQARYFARNSGKGEKFTSRKEGNGVRIWRVE